MNDSSPEAQPRMPGVRYKTETRYRQETTVIDGVPSTRSVPYDVLVPQPLRDWDEVILRGVTGLAVGITALAVIGTTASVGGQLSTILHPVIAYGTGVVFTATWVACMGLEWVSKTDPRRARPAQIAGWLALAISMGAVFSYGHAHGQDLAGAVGACLDLLSKGLWALLIHVHAVPLGEGVSHWLIEQEQKAAGRSLLARRISRLNRGEAYRQAVGGREYQVAGAILTTETAGVLPVPVAPGPPQPAPVPPTPGRGAPVSGQPVPPVSAPVTPAVQPQAEPVSGQLEPVSGQAQELPVEEAPLSQIGGGSIAGTVRQALVDHPEWESEDEFPALLAHCVEKHGDGPKFAATVRRSRDRDIKRRKAKAS